MPVVSSSSRSWPTPRRRWSTPRPPDEIEFRRQALRQQVEVYTESPYLQALRDSTLAEQFRQGELEVRWGRGEVVADAPEKTVEDRDCTEYHLAPTLSPYFRGAEQELIIFSPYSVRGKRGTAFLRDLSQRGVRVRICTNCPASADVSVVHAGYAKYRKDLLRSGIETSSGSCACRRRAGPWAAMC